MKRSLALLFIIFSFWSCEVVNTRQKIPLTMWGTFVVPESVATPIDNQEIAFDVSTDYYAVFPTKAKEGLIESITLDKLSIYSPTENLDYLKTVQVWISDPGKPKVKIAEGEVPENTENTLSLPVLQADFRNYVLDKNHINITVVVSTRSGFTGSKSIDINMTYSASITN